MNIKAAALVREKSCLDSKLSNRLKQRLSLYKGLQRTNLRSLFIIFSSIFWERVGFLGGGSREAVLRKSSREEGASLREEFFLFCFLLSFFFSIIVMNFSIVFLMNSMVFLVYSME